MKKIYLDYAATSPLDSEVIKIINSSFPKFGNPSSLHSRGREADQVLKRARKSIARFLGCLWEEVILTSGATEANNFALKGAVEAWLCSGRRTIQQKPHLIVSPIEHHSVLDTAKHLEKLGAEVSWLKVDKYGQVNPGEAVRLIKKNTVLVSVMYANNEVGTVQDIKTLARKVIKTRGRKKYPLLHTDAVQAIQYLDCNVNRLGVDFLSASAHKFSGPKGTGFLYIRKGTPLIRQLDGGKQEFNLRAGTENLPYIVGMAKALELAEKRKEEEKARLENLRDYLIKNCKFKIKNCYLTGHPRKRLPHIASFVIARVEGEAMLLHLDDQGIAASSGSACTSGELTPSHVLLGMGIKPEQAHGSLRFSLGKETKKKEVDYLLKALPQIVKKLRKMAREIG